MAAHRVGDDEVLNAVVQFELVSARRMLLRSNE
jgi:hypothetical protein